MVLDFLRRKAVSTPEIKASAAGPVIAYHTQGRVAWSPRDIGSLTRTGFAGNPVGFRSVKLIAEAAAALPLVLQDGQRRYDVHPVLSLVKRPNMAQGRAELLEALFGQLLLTGNAYVEAVQGEAELPLELHVLRSDRMRVVPGADGWPIAFEYSVGAKKHRFAVGAGVSPVMAAGGAFAGTLGPGEAVRIFTGGPVPAGADAVVIQEDTDADGSSITIKEAAKPGEWVGRLRGVCGVPG